jgi:hypothetical protein
MRIFNRRTFLQQTAVGGAGLVLASSCPARADDAPTFCIEAPVHGAVLNHRHGKESDQRLQIRVTGRAPAGSRVLVNGQLADRPTAKRFEASVDLRHRNSEIVATTEREGETLRHPIRVVWDRGSFPRYRFAIDDHIFFLRDIVRHNYRSLFDCFYLEFLRKLHRTYAAKFTLNVYFTDGDNFDLREFPSRYKAEWSDNADWLRLSFHARADLPARPYQHATAAQVISDYDQVTEQIHRFAGQAAYAPTTITHWAMLPTSAFQPLAERGVKVLSGYFRQQDGKWDINYCLDDRRSAYLSCHDAWQDFESGIVFTKIDLVCNHLASIDQVIPQLESLTHDPHQAELMDLTSHEQASWDFSPAYVADHAERIERAVRWVTDHGYQPVFFHEGFLGNTG